MKQRKTSYIISIVIFLAIVTSVIMKSDPNPPDSFNNDINVFSAIDDTREVTPEQVATILASVDMGKYDAELEKLRMEAQEGIEYYKASIIYNFGENPNGSVYADLCIRANAIMKTKRNCGNTYFLEEDPIYVWSEVISTGTYEWIEMYDPIVLVVSDESVSFRLRGTLVVPETPKLNSEDLVDKLGFVKTYKEQGIQYYRNTQTIFETYTL